jgi:hypothetical protein
MKPLAIAAAALACCACATPATMFYRHLDSVQPIARPAPATVVVLLPWDDRYDGEKQGETMTARFAFALPGVMFGSYRGNRVSSDESFAGAPGTFESGSISGSIGNLLVQALSRSGAASAVEGRQASVQWTCADGTCTPDTAAIRELAPSGAAEIVATRIAHFYGVQFGEKIAMAAAHQEVRGAYVYNVTETLVQARSSGSAGACVLEVTVLSLRDGRIVRAARRSFSGTSYLEASGEGALGDAAVAALTECLDGVVREMPGTIAAVR